MQYYRKEKWANRDIATKKDVLLMGQILIDKFKTVKNNNTATCCIIVFDVKQRKREVSRKKGQKKDKGHKWKENHSPWAPAHSYGS